ncbi:MAG TPA: hypothetical protein PLL09_08525 [Flavobacterium sp.]|uniref:hypothetical protein n=1 Tax=unclassified Flavobacterium TaxID=196869 RepID=UPI0025BC24FB|nr:MULTISPECIES: hypothetical protein [unclassified Flavobacterium]HRE77856.1 hypothetical protein [Flavobacterium sp.]
MKKLILSVMLLSGVFVFAQETKKVEKTEKVNTTTTEKTAEAKKAEKDAKEAEALKAMDPKNEAEIKAKKEAKKEE